MPQKIEKYNIIITRAQVNDCSSKHLPAQSNKRNTEKSVKYVENDVKEVVLVSLLLTLGIFHIFSIVNFKGINF